MRHFRGSMITAGLRKDNSDRATPSEAELHQVQIHGLVLHLTDDHSLCWPEVCWHKNNPDLDLQEPHLKNASNDELQQFENMLTAIFKIPERQSLVTSTRTSHNEAFNRCKLVFLDKKVDYWKTYMARHACAVMLRNLGLLEMLKLVRLGCGRGFSEVDIQNLEKIARDMEAKQLYNRSKIEDRNQTLHTKYAEAREELHGPDFSLVSLVLYLQLKGIT
jgi:hypothetical protein